MALTAGSVSIADDGTETKTDAASRLYDILLAQAQSDSASFGQPFPSGAESVPVKRGIAKLANNMASWLVTEITTYAQAKIPNSASGDGLQRTPNPNDPDTATKRPASDKFLAIV